MRGGRLQTLTAHPDAASAAVESLQAGVARRPDGALEIVFVLTGDIGRLSLPHPREPQRTDGLWRHTCFECFVAGAGERYREYNFSPSGEWAAYAFSAYRVPEAPPPAFEPRIAVAAEARRLELHAVVAAGALPERVVRVGLSAVIEEVSGGLSYWALRHAPGRPDFHHRAAFALEP